MNIFNLLYKYSPLNFYTNTGNHTIIKSIHNPSAGYEFDRQFSEDETGLVWKQVRLHRRISTIIIFFMFIAALYEFVFPHFSLFVNNTWVINALIMLTVLLIVCVLSNLICKYSFEKRLLKNFGTYKPVKFKASDVVDSRYCFIFKIELIKALAVILFVVLAFIFISPFEVAQKLVDNERYPEAIKLATIGAKVFPIAQEWYALRGYSKFRTGDYPGAIEDYDKAYKLSADRYKIMNFDNKIFVKYFIGDYGGALSDYDREIKKSPNEDERSQFLWDKAQFLYNIKMYEQSLEIYDTLILNSDDDNVLLLKDRLYLDRAHVHKALGETEEMKSDLQNAGVTEEELNLTPIPKPVLMFDAETTDGQE